MSLNRICGIYNVLFEKSFFETQNFKAFDSCNHMKFNLTFFV